MAATNNIQQNALIRGSSCWVYAGKDSSNAKKIGFCDSFRCSKNFQLQRANGLGELRPFSIDAQGYQVTLSMSGFIPSKSAVSSNDTIRGKGDATILNFNVDIDDVIDEKVTKFPYIALKHAYKDSSSASQNDVVLEVTDAVEQAFNVTAQGPAYLKGDISFEAADMDLGDGMVNKTSLNS